MISSEQIAELLKSYEQDSIVNVMIGYDGRVVCRLKSRIDPCRSYMFSVHRLTDEHILRFHISCLAKIRLEGEVPKSLAFANFCFFSGGMGIDSENTVTFQINHPCRDDDNDPSPQVLEKLMSELIKSVDEIEEIIISAVLRDMGLSYKSADNITGILFGDPHQAADETG